MYLHKVVNLDKNLSKVQKNKELHKAAFNLLEENLIKEFRLKKEDLKYMIGLNGKPCLKKGSPFFSISHCDNIVVCIISERNVGIDIEDIKEEVIEVATNEARKEVIRLLGGVISGMNVGQPVIMQAANSEAQEPTEDVMDDADVAGLAMGWMSKGD